MATLLTQSKKQKLLLNCNCSAKPGYMHIAPAQVDGQTADRRNGLLIQDKAARSQEASAVVDLS